MGDLLLDQMRWLWSSLTFLQLICTASLHEAGVVAYWTQLLAFLLGTRTPPNRISSHTQALDYNRDGGLRDISGFICFSVIVPRYGMRKRGRGFHDNVDAQYSGIGFECGFYFVADHGSALCGV